VTRRPEDGDGFLNKRQQQRRCHLCWHHFFCFVFWICNARHTFRMLVSDYIVIRDVRLETYGAHVSFPLSGASRISLSYIVVGERTTPSQTRTSCTTRSLGRRAAPARSTGARAPPAPTTPCRCTSSPSVDLYLWILFVPAICRWVLMRWWRPRDLGQLIYLGGMRGTLLRAVSQVGTRH
jgi:hypothetical protein